MKNCILLFFLLTLMGAQSQTRISFTYDSAGNQTQRIICTSCPSRISNDSIKTLETLTESDLIKDDLYDQISYYPNPVREELYVKWVNDNKTFVASIELYSMSGQLIKRYSNLRVTNMATITFQDYPQGFYNLILIYADGEKKTLKIVKK